MFDAGTIGGGLKFDLSEYASGILQAQAISAVVPQFVLNFVENPMLALIETAKRAAEAVIGAVEGMAHSFHDVELAALKAGTSVEFLSRLEAAAKPAGVGLDALVNGFKILEQRAELAAEGNEAAVKGFARLGISAAQAKTLMEEPEKFFATIKDRIGAIEDPALRTSAALGVMGRGGFNLVPLLAQSSAETKKFQDIIEGLGGTVNTQEGAMGAKFGQLQSIVDAAWTGIKKTVAEPILQFVADHFDEIVGKVQEYAAAIRDGVVTAFNILGPVVKGAWTFFEGLGGVLSSVLVPAFNALVPVLKIAGDLLAGIFQIIGPVLSGIGSIVSGVTDAIGLTDSSGRSGGSSSGAGQVNSPITVNASFAAVDPDAASTQIAAKLRPHILEAKQQQDKQLKDVVHRQNVNATLKGGR